MSQQAIPSIPNMNQGTTGIGPVQPVGAPTSTNAQIAGAAATTGAGEGLKSLKTTEELRKKSPKLYNMMMQGIGYTICNQMKHSSDRVIEEIRKSQEHR